MTNLNIYSTRTMLAAVSLMMPVHSFFKDTFFPVTDTVVTESIDVDFKKGKRKMAPFVAPRVGGVVMDRQGFVTKTLKPGKIAPERVITVDDITTRSLGESLYSNRTPEQRAKEMLATDLSELDEYIARREEWMCREVLINGKVVMKGEGYESVLDYQFTNKEVLAGTAKWSDPASDPLADLKRWRLSIVQKTGMTPDILVFASDVVETFTQHPKVKEALDVLRVNLGVIEPSVKSPAVTFVGKLPALGVEIYSYDEWFLDDEDQEQAMIPEGHLVLGVSGKNKRLYAAVTQTEKGQFVTIEGERVPKFWVDEQNEVQKLRLASRPVPVPEDVDSWFVGVVK
ncbi:major capsid protein [Mesobacillus thioparans]|uniref:major capsid protein n=1 Tax=Mesobacillus thioparans TaxID=370439 RepID=UPI0039EE6697